MHRKFSKEFVWRLVSCSVSIAIFAATNVAAAGVEPPAVMVEITREISRIAPEFRPNVTFRKGVIVLSGRFRDSAQHHDLLTRLGGLAEVRGIVDVSCDAKDEPTARSTGTTSRRKPTFEVTNFALQTAVQWDPRIDYRRVHAELQDDAAVLTGDVDSEWARAAVLRAVAGVEGVEQVDDRLSVRPRVGVSGRDLARRSRQALRQATTIGKGILITAQGADVRLYGRVASLCESRLAEDIVATVAGVAAVDNQLTITGMAPPAKLSARDLIDAMAWNSGVDPRGIRVTVSARRVGLDGYVATSAERIAAEKIARDAGALVVANRLRVAPSKSVFNTPPKVRPPVIRKSEAPRRIVRPPG